MRDEKKISEEALQQTASLLAATLECTADGLLVIDNNGKVTIYNNKFLSMWHIPESLAAKRDDKILLENVLSQLKDPEAFTEKVKQLYSQPEADSFDVLEFKDGRVFERFSQPQRLGNETVGRVWSFRDVTDRRRVEEEQRKDRETAQRLADETAIIADIGRLIGSTLDIDQVYEKFAAETRKLIPFDRIAVNLCNIRENIVTVAYVSGIEIPNRKKGDTPPLTGTLSELVVRGRTGLIIQSENIDEIVRRIPALSRTFQAGLRSLMGVPLISQDEVIGALQFRAEKKNAYTEQDLQLAERIGGQIAGAIANAQLFTDLKKTEMSLREREEQYRTLVDNASDIVFSTDNTGHFTFVNPTGIRIVGYEKEEIIGKHYPTLIRQDRREEAIRFFGRQFVKGIQNTYSEYPVITKEGGEIWLGQNTKLLVQNGHVEGFQAIARDITALKQIEEELRRNHDVTERLAQEIAIIAEIGKVIGSTLDTEEIYERFAAEVRKLIPFDRLSVNLHDLDQGIVSTVYVFGEYVANRQPGDSFPLKGSVSEVLVRTRVGMFSHPLSVEEMDKRFPDHSATIQAGMRSLIGVPLISQDKVIASLHFRSRKPNAYTEQDLRLAERIGEQIAGAIANAQLYAGLKKTEQELKDSEQRYRDLSIIDDLTQLYNSRHFYFQLKSELDRSNRYEQPLTLLLLDLDNFKTFNDAYGHVEGDQVLMRLGHVVKRCLRETDFAYRYGGEEFTILLPMTTSADGAVTAERIRTEFTKETFSPAPGQDVHVTVSIGLAQYKPKEEMKAFVHRVDQLMYQGKKNGKDRVCYES
jgi:diguanylate cyclase (GGDEF)-like protein/PAS domain S-box-containing protein